MNILKADACANKSGIVLDSLRFSDRFRTLDHNPSEVTRLNSSWSPRFPENWMCLA